jgi:hypothetical protein
MALQRKKRAQEYSLGSASFKSVWWISPTVFFDLDNQFKVYSVIGNQVTDSEGHGLFIRLRKERDNHRKVVFGSMQAINKDYADLGGDFYTARSFVSNEKGEPSYAVPNLLIHPNVLNNNHTGFDDTYKGVFLPVDPAPRHFPTAHKSTDVELDQLGAIAISLCKPTSPASDVATFVGELYRDGLPTLPALHSLKDRIFSAKSAGNEYLNVQFGWKPLVSDVKKIAESIHKADKILGQYERDAGKGVRRKFTFPTVTTVEERPISGDQPHPIGPPLGCFSDYNGRLTCTRTTVTQSWFSGMFTYYLPSDYDSRRKVVRQALLARKLLGISPTPDVLWELTPWSWMIDWFGDFGRVMSTISDFAASGLVMRYGYIMQRVRITDTYTLDGVSTKNSRPDGSYTETPVETSLSFTTISKTRRKADPFGFGLKWADFSPFQLSILGALGMSRGSR